MFDRPNEAVTPSGQSFDVTGPIRGVSERLAKLVYGGVQTVFKIDKGSAVPQLLLDIFAPNHFAGPVQQNLKDSEGLTRESEPRPVLAKFTGGAIVLIRAEDDWL